MTPRWHGTVGCTFLAKDDTFCGRVGEAYPCESYEQGFEHGLAWILEHASRGQEDFLRHKYDLEVRFY